MTKEPKVIGTEFEEEADGEWFPFFSSGINEQGVVTYSDPKPGAGRAKVRSLTPFFEERRAGRKKKSEFILNPQTRAMERVSYFEDLPPAEQKKENEDAWDYAITGIRNAFSAPNVPIQCTRESKVKLLEIQVFLRFINKVLQIISESGAKQKEETEENL